MKQHGADEGQAAAHFNLGDLNRDALALGHAVIGLPKISIARVLLDIDHVVIDALFQAQAKLLNALFNDGGATNQSRARQTFIGHDLCGAQNALFFTFTVGHALF